MSDELIAAVESGDVERTVALLASMTEPERRDAARAVGALHARAHRDEGALHVRASDAPARESIRLRHRCATLALFGTGTLAAARGCDYDSSERIADVLLARRPAWTQAWAESVVVRRWPLVRRLMKAGLYERVDSDGYTLGLIAQIARRDLRAFLEAEPDLLAIDVWSFFVHEGHGETSLSAADKYVCDERSWASILAALSADGLLARARLLDATLDALERDFAPFRAGWFSRFHERLTPTIDERCERASRYARLLGSRNPATVAFALRALERLEKAGRSLPSETFVALEPAYCATAKSTALGALRLGARLLGPDPSPSSLGAFVSALEHPSREVQRAALDALEPFAERTSAELAARLTEVAGSIAPTLRDRFASLGFGRPVATASVPRQSSSEPVFAERPRAADVWSHIVPISDVWELVEACTAVVEAEASPDALERVLDGLSRLGAQRPDRFERLTGPLRKRALHYTDPAYRGSAASIRRMFAALARAWLTGERVAFVGAESGSVPTFLRARAWEMAERLAHGIDASLLAAPTHVGCRVDAHALVARLHATTQPIGRLDLIGALLRLAPDGRGVALASARALPGEIGDAVRYALGDDDVVVGADAALWIAASRARDPHADDPLVERVHGTLGPDTTRATSFGFAWNERSIREYRLIEPVVSIVPKLHDELRADVPTSELYRFVIPRHGDRTTAEAIRWMATIWPANREGFFARGCSKIGSNIDWWEARWENRAFFEPLFHDAAACGPAARTLIALGLLAKNAEEGAAAVDAAIAAIDDGRLEAFEMGEVVGHIVSWSASTKTKRAVPRLASIAHASPRHTPTVLASLTRALAPAHLAHVAALRPLLALSAELAIECEPTSRVAIVR